jgi:hypothetical protein
MDLVLIKTLDEMGMNVQHQMRCGGGFSHEPLIRNAKQPLINISKLSPSVASLYGSKGAGKRNVGELSAGKAISDKETVRAHVSIDNHQQQICDLAPITASRSRPGLQCSWQFAASQI